MEANINELQEQLLRELSHLISHLKKYREDRWAKTFLTIYKQVDEADRRGVEALRRMRGGMGSFFDLVICKINGHAVEKTEENFANEELMRLGAAVLKTADQLSRLLNKNSRK